MVLVIEAAQASNPCHRLLVTDVTTQRIGRIGGIRDHRTCVELIDHLEHQSPLRIDRMNCDVLCHGFGSAGLGPQYRLKEDAAVILCRMKTLMDWLPALAFVAAYVVYDIYVATAVLIATLFAAVAVHRLRTGEWHKTNAIAAIIALLLGGLTLWIRDPMFIKLKPTAVYAIFAVVLAGSHFVGDKPLMARIPPSMIDLPDWLWSRINAAWAVFFLLCAVVNVPIAFYLPESTWVMIKTFGYTGASFLFLLAHLPFIAPYLPKEEEAQS